MNTKLAGKSDSTHTHDDRYYTESEINSKLNFAQPKYCGTIVQSCIGNGRFEVALSDVGCSSVPSCVFCVAQSFHGFMTYDYDTSLSIGKLSLVGFESEYSGAALTGKFFSIGANVVVRFAIIVYM